MFTGFLDAVLGEARTTIDSDAYFCVEKLSLVYWGNMSEVIQELHVVHLLGLIGDDVLRCKELEVVLMQNYVVHAEHLAHLVS